MGAVPAQIGEGLAEAAGSQGDEEGVQQEGNHWSAGQQATEAQTKAGGLGQGSERPPG